MRSTNSWLPCARGDSRKSSASTRKSSWSGSGAEAAFERGAKLCSPWRCLWETGRGTLRIGNLLPKGRRGWERRKHRPDEPTLRAGRHSVLLVRGFLALTLILGAPMFQTALRAVEVGFNARFFFALGA